MSTPKRYTVTSALPYANGALHLGHLAGAYLPADIFVRYLRLKGKDVVWVCGSDEHGAAITIRAKKESIDPQSIIDKYHVLNKQSFVDLGISFDMYHRTSSDLHHETAQDFFKHLYEKGDEFIEETNDQYYDEEFNQFLADRYITGTCPKCAHPEAYGDQCENCGSDLSPTELINPKSTLSKNTPVLRSTTHWYFKLDKHTEWMKDWVENGKLDGQDHHDPKAWKNHVMGQCSSWLSDLRPRAITRDLDWGIKVPVEGADGKVLYVWFDAPIGYISATKQWAADNGKDWKDYWQDEDTELIHFIGKDNIVFHCIVFPAMLKAHGDYILPTNVPANQFLNFEGRKFSKSKGWGIEMHQYLEEFKDFPNKEDALRYALIRNMPETKDADFKWDEFTEFHDNELVANLGNFINRVVVLTNKYYDGIVPIAVDNEAAITELAGVKTVIDELCGELDKYNFRHAILKLMELSSIGNTYLQDVSPWKIWKDDNDNQAVKNCIHNCIQIVGYLSVVCEPFLPFSSEKIRTILNLPKVENGDLTKVLGLLDNNSSIIPGGHKIGEPALLFAKINDRKDHARLELIEQQKVALQAILDAEIPAHEPVKETATFEDFTKLDIRTGTITEAEKIRKTKKLLKLTVDIGFETRTIVSGLAEHYKPEDLVGQEVVLLVNLAPRKLKGVESQGMVLTAENTKGKLCLISPKEVFGNGFVVK